MKKILFSIVFVLLLSNVFAKHISGGEMSYVYLGPGTNPGTGKFLVTLKLYRECNAPPDAAQLDPTATFTVFTNLPYVQVRNIEGVPGDPIQIIQKIPDNPCIDDAIESAVCFQTRTYTTTIDNLPITTNGYIVAYQRCCRIDGMTNISSFDVGSTYFAKIPGNLNLGAETNTSPVFVSNDAVLICSGRPFNFDFSATDADNDSLVYSFYNAYSGGGIGAGVCTTCTTPDPASTPPFQIVIYNSPYSSAQPLGPTVSINGHTGLISGTAPYLGAGANSIFDITVLVNEYRRGIKIGEHFKDLQVRVVDCKVATAILNPKPATCDGFTVQFTNDAANNPEPTYYWDFGDGDTSTAPNPSHTYAAAGVYTLKLIVDKDQPCSDSATRLVRVFPGFFPGFNFAGSCTNTAVQFTDQSTTNYPTINSWTWNFGDNITSTAQNPTHAYASSGAYNASLIVASDKGCVDTITKVVNIYDAPPLSVQPRDTLICNLDTVRLNAIGTGTFLWSPNYMINDVTSATPLVSPDVTTTYTVTLRDAFGCPATDTVRVNVVTFVTLFKPNDSTLCRGDAVVLKIVSDALHYNWTPAGSLNDPTLKNPTATPTGATTTYHVVANIGKCVSEADIKINTVPYPAADAGFDQEICFGTSTQLQASGGTIYVWSPTTFLDNSHIANPRVINPTAGVRYVVTVRDTLGCPKAVRDTVVVLVDRLTAYLGSVDTSVVLGQPLQLNAFGGINYLWTPSTWLDNPNISNPIALPQENILYVVRVSNNIGCVAYGSIKVNLFKIPADMYVPTAFSPNGLNKLFAPILRGIKSLDLFKVYNRWGQMLFSNTNPETGWDGTFGGRPQDAGTYVWYAEATDYKGTKIRKKGYVVLIR